MNKRQIEPEDEARVALATELGWTGFRYEGGLLCGERPLGGPPTFVMRPIVPPMDSLLMAKSHKKPAAGVRVTGAGR
jgi:hypothetical protein